MVIVPLAKRRDDGHLIIVVQKKRTPPAMSQVMTRGIYLIGVGLSLLLHEERSVRRLIGSIPHDGIVSASINGPA